MYTGDGILESAGNERGFLSSVSYPHRSADLYKTYCISQRRKMICFKQLLSILYAGSHSQAYLL